MRKLRCIIVRLFRCPAADWLETTVDLLLDIIYLYIHMDTPVNRFLQSR